MAAAQLAADVGAPHLAEGRKAINAWLHKMAADEGKRTRLVDIERARIPRGPSAPGPA